MTKQSAYHAALRRELLTKAAAASPHPYVNMGAETIGAVTGPLISVGLGLGSMIGGALGDKSFGEQLGASIGSYAPGVAAAIAALATKRRSHKEQAKKETLGRAVAKLLVPGIAAYDSLKRIGSTANPV